MAWFRSVFFALAAAVALSSPGHAAETGHWAGIAERISTAIADGEKLAAEGKHDAAREAIEGAYFDIFEETKMETAERLHLGMPRVTVVEDLFHQAEDAAGTEKSPGLGKITAKLRAALRKDARKLDQDGIAENGVAKK